MHAYERHADDMHAHRIHAPAINICPRVISAEISLGKRPGRSEALTTPMEEEQLEPFYKVLEGSAGASEV